MDDAEVERLRSENTSFKGDVVIKCTLSERFCLTGSRRKIKRWPSSSDRSSASYRVRVSHVSHVSGVSPI